MISVVDFPGAIKHYDASSTCDPDTIKRFYDAAAVEFDKTAQITNNFTDLSATILDTHPDILGTLRMMCLPTMAKDRLVSLAGLTQRNVIDAAELNGYWPGSIDFEDVKRIHDVIIRHIDRKLFSSTSPHNFVTSRAVAIDRRQRNLLDTWLRNDKEKRQQQVVQTLLETHSFQYADNVCFTNPSPGKFGFNKKIRVTGEKKHVPADVIIWRHDAVRGDYPVVVELKSAGDEVNTNKRGKEHSSNVAHLRREFPPHLTIAMVVSGYAASPSYTNAFEGQNVHIICEHQIDDLTQLVA